MAPSTDTPVHGSQRGRRWALVTACGVVLLTIAAGLVIWQLQRSPASHGPAAVVVRQTGATDPQVAHILVIDCAGAPAATEPTALNLTCGDGSIIFNRIVWSSWSGAAAIGTGMLGEDNCVPNCATGTIVTESATVTLTAPGPAADSAAASSAATSGAASSSGAATGAEIYTSMTITPVPPNKAGFHTITAKLPQ
ncbi:hypothetical protein SAMN05444157_1019 [Frankineae bacterium MT45]|nr:hypothetical protein SAMN05444157_1019 [Frankineae bacterium MT45]